MIKKIQYFIQRGLRGYSDEDLWDFSSYLCEIIPPALRKLKSGTGCPSDLWDKEAKNNECHKWAEMLEEMAQGFEAAEALNNCDFMMMTKTDNGWERKIDEAKMKLLTVKYDKGIGLFAKHFLDLWD